MKQMMSIGRLSNDETGDSIIDRDCVWVHLYSIDGADFIRIHSCAEGEENVCQPKFSYEIVGLTVTFTATLSLPADRVFWEFGDGEYESNTGLTAVHTYEEAGDYSVVCRGYQLDTAETISSETVTFTVESRGPAASAISHADSYSIWSGLSWTAGGDRSGYVASKPSGSWMTNGQRMIATVPLQNIAAYDAVIEQRALIYVTGRWLTYIVLASTETPIIKKVSGSDMGLSIRPDNNTPNDNIAGLVDKTIPMVESSIQMVDASDTDPWVIIPDDPDVFGSNTGWNGLSNADTGSLEAIPYLCMNKLTKIITV